MAATITGCASKVDAASKAELGARASASTTTAPAPGKDTIPVSRKSPGCAKPSRPVAGVSTDAVVTVKDATEKPHSYRYWIRIPAKFDPTVHHSLVVTVHAKGASALEQMQMADFNKLADADQTIVVAPTAPGGAWTATGAQLAAFDAVVGDVIGKHCVDVGRIGVNGFADGGTFVGYVACKRSETIASFAMVAGTYFEETQCAGSLPASVLVIFGAADPVAKIGTGKPVGGIPTVGGAAGVVTSWAQLDGCAAQPNDDKSVEGAVVRTFENCVAGSTAQIVAVTDGGATWPGSGVAAAGKGKVVSTPSASKLIWAFHLDHTLGN